MINDIALLYIEKIRRACYQKKPLLVISCNTYNHEKYLRQALGGFVMQQTNFRFIVIVHEDASTDHTANVLMDYSQRYPDLIFPIFEKENQYTNPNGSVTKVMNEAYKVTGAKYIALCEGDDYWTDPLKLQKQVDFLESHPDYGMCYTKVRRYEQAKDSFIDVWGGSNVNFEDLLLCNTIPTPTVVISKDIYEKYQDEITPFKHHWSMGDYPLWLYIAANSKIKFFPESTAVYRILEKSASHSANAIDQLKFILNFWSISLFFAQKYNSNNIKILYNNIIWFNLLIRIVSLEPYKKFAFQTLWNFKSHRLLFCIISIICHRKLNVKILKGYLGYK